MKILNLLFIILGMISISCNNEESSLIDNDSREDTSLLIQEEEKNEISIEAIDKEVAIVGGIKQVGDFPSPNSNMDFKIDTTEKKVLKGTTLNVEFSSQVNISGAYVRFREVQGENSESYFNVPSTSFGGEKNIGGAKILSSNNLNVVKSAAKLKQSDNTIIVSFSKTIPPGKMSFDICIYDEEGNISQVQTLCIVVREWGGNSEISGNWKFDRFDYLQQKEIIICENKDKIQANIAEVLVDQWALFLGEDGTYLSTINRKVNFLNTGSTIVSCSPIYTTFIDENAKYTGNWFFNQETNKLTVVDFVFEDLDNIENNKKYEGGDLRFNAVEVKLIGNQLELTLEYWGVRYLAYFSKD